MSATHRLRLLTLNTWGFRWPLGRHRDVRLARLSAHLRTNPYDLVALQELWGSSPARLGPSGLRWVDGDGPPARAYRRDAHGLGLQVRAGLAAARVRIGLYSRSAGFDRLKTKGFEVATVSVGETPVHVVNTHLQAGARAAHVRRHQLDELLAAADALAGPVILTGDFNLFRHGAEDRAAHAALGAAGFHDASEALDRPEPTWRTANPYVPKSDADERFDRVYLRNGLRPDGTPVDLVAEDVQVLVDHAAPLSDHEALSVTLALRAR
jgi:endonuclease/exonuclease/phosphatase family metal-dependent hydrolase